MNSRKPFKTGCKVCGEPKIRSLGLCDAHYQRYRSRLKACRSEAEAKAFEAQCLADGWITAPTRGGRPKAADDPFDEVIAKVRERDLDAEADAIVEEMDRAVTQEETREQAKPTTKRASRKKKSG